MATLTGNQIDLTYQGLIKLDDNGAIDPTVLKQITDGTGGSLPIQVSQVQTKFQSLVDFTGATVTGISAGGLTDGVGTNSMISVVGASNASAAGASDIAIGQGASASGGNSISIGTDNSSLGGFSTSVGVYTEAGGNYASAIGALCNASGTNSLAVGKQATSSDSKTLSIGIETSSGGTESIVIGSNTSTVAYRGISIGQGNQVGTNSSTIGQYSRTGSASIAMGDNANNAYGAKNNAVSLGAGTNAETNSTAIGKDSRALGSNSVSIGINSQSTAYGAIALGDGVIAGTADTLTIKLLQIGNYATMNFADDAAAATAGIPLGGVYHTSGALKIRIT